MKKQNLLQDHHLEHLNKFLHQDHHLEHLNKFLHQDHHLEHLNKLLRGQPPDNWNMNNQDQLQEQIQDWLGQLLKHLQDQVPKTQ